MEVGEKYLTIVVLGQIKLVAFPNEKTKAGSPDFKGNGIAVWVNEKRPSQKPQVEDVL